MIIIRIWDYRLLPYLPDLQFRSQLRELVAIMRSWRDNGTTNHLLINKVMEYERNELVRYYIYYETVYHSRYGKWIDQKYWEEFKAFQKEEEGKKKYYSDGWHNKQYLRVCMANLYEKHFFGVGKSKITDEEWETLCRGYKEITNEEWVL